MENRANILEELSTIAPTLVNISNKNVYTLPFSYWESVASDVLRKINEGQEPQYYFTRENIYSVPDGYFTNLAESILRQVKQSDHSHSSEVFEEMEQISPLLNTISKKPVQSVPAGYFDQVKVPVAGEKTEAKVVSISRFTKIIRYAVAAVVCSLLAIGGYLLATKEPATLQARTEKASSDLNKLSEQEIIDLLSSGTGAEVYSSASAENPGGAEISRSVKEMSDEDIKQYLLEVGEHEGI